MSETTQITMWYIQESSLAWQYSRIPPERNPQKEDKVWIPKSIVEHRSKDGGDKVWSRHIVTLPDWYVTRENL